MTDKSPLDELAKRRAKKQQAQPADAAPDDRPQIYLEPGRIHESVEQAEQALVAADLQIYDRDGSLVKVVGLEKQAKGIKRPAGATQIVPVTSAHLVPLLASAAQFFKPRRASDGATNWSPCDPPGRLADGIIANPEPLAPPLIAFIEAPIVAPDGTLHDEPGYIEPLELLLTAKPPEWQRPKAKPTQADAQAAIEQLREVLASFPFEDDSDLAAAIAVIVSGLQRRVMTSCPIFGINAPTPGTGKSLLADVFSIICTGRPAAVMSIGDDAAELEKRFGAVLIAGDGFINVDNVSIPLKSDLLCSVSTQDEVLIRVLGVSKRTRITTRALIVLTGNNLVVRGDLTRRVCPIRLNAHCEQPEKRVFKRDAKAVALEQRAQLIAAALTIPLGYLADGCPKVGASPYGSFPTWDRMVRFPLIWAGLPDPLGAVQGLRDGDPDLECHTAMLQAWSSAFGSRAVSAQDAVSAALDRFAGSDSGAGRLVHPDLNEAMQLAIGRAGNITSRSLGAWLRQHKDRPVAGLVFRAGPVRRGIGQWLVEDINADAS
jgi:putative DNA primase/helicase